MNTYRCLVGSVLVLVPVLTVVSAQQPRQVLHARQEPLITFLRVTDQQLVIRAPVSPPFTVGPEPGQTTAPFQAAAYDCVLSVRDENIRGVLIKQITSPPTQDQDRCWHVPAPEDQADRITSTVTARVETVMKGGPG